MAGIKKGLGKGLDVFFDKGAPETVVDDNSSILMVDINKVEPNREQPRKYFDEEALNELSNSLKEFGIIQPIIVKKEDGYYSIIAGERRWRAARMARLAEIPVIVKEYTDLEILEVALIENVQRSDLNPIEQAVCYKRLQDEYNLTQDEIARKVSKDRSTIANSLRLLNLDKRVQNFIIENRLTTGHCRALLSISDLDLQFELAEKIIEENLSVRSVEALVKSILNPEPKAEKKKESKPQDSHLYKSIENDLKSIFGTKVTIRNGKNKGKIEIEYFSNEDLDRLLLLIRNIENN